MTTPNKPSHKSIDPTIEEILHRLHGQILAHEKGTYYDDYDYNETRNKQKLEVVKATAQIKDLINKAVLEARLDELNLISLVNNKDVFVGVKSKDSTEAHIRTRTLQFKQELTGEEKV